MTAAAQAAAIEQQKLEEQLSTRDAVIRARAELDTARQQLAAAQAASRGYTSLTTISVPVAGMVAAVSAADGQYVNAGQTLTTIAPTAGLYVVADLFGSNASSVVPGMKGVFLPEGNNAIVQVVVQRVSRSLTAPGQVEVWLKAGPGYTLDPGRLATFLWSCPMTGRWLSHQLRSFSTPVNGGYWCVTGAAAVAARSFRACRTAVGHQSGKVSWRANAS